MALSLFRRHIKSCGQTSRRYRRCRCPISVEGTLAGESIRKALDLTSWEAAEHLIHEWNRAGKIVAEGLKRISVADAVEKFLADCRARDLAPATVQLYSNFLLKHLLPWVLSTKLVHVRDVDVNYLREYRESWKWAAATAARRIERLRSFFAFCVDAGWIEKNPAKSVKPPKVGPSSKIPFTEHEVHAIVSACEKLVTRGRYSSETNRARVRAFVFILRYTGLRISDAAKLDTSRYRAPLTNSGTSGSANCSGHVYGKAADLGIRNASGQHDCAIWNSLAAAAHAQGAWVESWAELVARGTPNHVHVEFGRAANDDYGTCNPEQLP